MKLYEKEIAGAEKQLISKSLSEKLSGEVVEPERNLKVETHFAPKEREKLKLEACEIAKQRLEPKLLPSAKQDISIALKI